MPGPYILPTGLPSLEEEQRNRRQLRFGRITGSIRGAAAPRLNRLEGHRTRGLTPTANTNVALRAETNLYVEVQPKENKTKGHPFHRTHLRDTRYCSVRGDLI